MKEQLVVSWTPDGVQVQRLVDGEPRGTGTYGSIDSALDGLRLMMESLERAYMFLGMSDRQIEAEILARGFEGKLKEIGRSVRSQPGTP